MSSPFVGQLLLVPYNFTPAGWLLCNGQLLAISEYDTLFNLIGTTYGGDGQSTFAVPDLQGRAPLHMGQSGGLSNYVIGQNGGVENVTLTTAQIPNHSHPMRVANALGDSQESNGDLLGDGQTVYRAATPATALAASTVGFVGGSQPHSNLQPFLTLNWIISAFGVFPSQT